MLRGPLLCRRLKAHDLFEHPFRHMLFCMCSSLMGPIGSHPNGLHPTTNEYWWHWQCNRALSFKSQQKSQMARGFRTIWETRNSRSQAIDTKMNNNNEITDNSIWKAIVFALVRRGCWLKIYARNNSIKWKCWNSRYELIIIVARALENMSSASKSNMSAHALFSTLHSSNSVLHFLTNYYHFNCSLHRQPVLFATSRPV